MFSGNSNTVSVNGETIKVPGNARSITVSNGKVYIDGELFQNLGSKAQITIVVEGNVGSVTSDGSVECSNVMGDVKAGSYVECGDVVGDVQAGSYVEAESIKGSVKAGSYIEYNGR